MKKINAISAILLAFGLYLLSFSYASAASILTEDFNAYSAGSVIGQGGWESYANGSNFLVQDTISLEGKALYNNSSADSVITKQGASLSDGSQIIYVKTINRSSWGSYGDGNVQMRIIRGDWGGSENRNFSAITFKRDGNVT